MSKNPTWTWHELMTADPSAAQRFYTSLLGLKAETWPDPAMQYTILSSASGGLGGIMSPPPGAEGAPSAWMGVVGVPDTDATVARCKELGGAVHNGPFDIPNVGRYAVLADPTGAVFAVMTPTGEGDLPNRQEMGRVSWNELWTSDPEAAWVFYRELFGWVETGTMDMGPQGLYRMYTAPGDTNSLGGIAARMPDQPVSAWAFYFNVPDCAASIEATRAAGGAVFFGPHDVPGGGKMAMMADPQGAVFATYEHQGS